MGPASKQEVDTPVLVVMAACDAFELHAVAYSMLPCSENSNPTFDFVISTSQVRA